MRAQVEAGIILLVRTIAATFRVTSLRADGGCTGHWTLSEHPMHCIIISVNCHIVGPSTSVIDVKRLKDELLFLDFRTSVPWFLHLYIQLLSRQLVVDLIDIRAIQVLITFFILTYVLDRHDFSAGHASGRSTFVRPIGLRCMHGGQVGMVLRL